MLNFSENEIALLGRVAGEIVLSDDPGGAMKRWREFFNISQKALSQRIMISSSVISDYEGGRRGNPGVQFVGKFVKALFEIDKERGEISIRDLGRLASPSSPILDVREFPAPISLKRFARAISGEVLTPNTSLRKVLSFAVVDATKALENFPGLKALHLLEIINERAVIFINMKREATPMVALRFSILKPKVVAYQGLSPTEFDIKLAESENVTLIYSKAESAGHLTKALMKLYSLALRKNEEGEKT